MRGVLALVVALALAAPAQAAQLAWRAGEVADAPFFWSRHSPGEARLTSEGGEPVLGAEYTGEQDSA